MIGLGPLVPPDGSPLPVGDRLPMLTVTSCYWGESALGMRGIIELGGPGPAYASRWHCWGVVGLGGVCGAAFSHVPSTPLCDFLKAWMWRPESVQAWEMDCPKDKVDDHDSRLDQLEHRTSDHDDGRHTSDE
ncbi:hypothetical protein NDU88_001298 [Pleurodeles waltl]|uniref:Uncharacterized protein n=1 Tax=Pleurodeles waltl TaxID=8319 RepID=A0AAV7M0Q3_PLEWA|nr:hypothetical protein NDU88_001298 [Pleurodeles waltl]